MEILNWRINPELKKEAEEHYRTKFAISLKDRDPLIIIHQITFDGVAPSIEIKDIENLFDFVDKNFLKGKIKRTGVEVGSGPATFSSVLAKRDSVEKMYAVEVCQPIVEFLMPKVAKYILGERKNKVVGAVGSFDNMELLDESVDFIFDFFSLHHSNDLGITLRECQRILKPGGFVLCFDKARPDHFRREDLDELLDAEYPARDKEKLFGVPASQKFTRRMNGEKEYRLNDWIQAFKNAGLSKVEYFYLAKVVGNRLSKFIKNLISFLPPKMQIYINSLLLQPKFSHKFILSSKNRIFSKLVNPFPKEISLLIAYK